MAGIPHMAGGRAVGQFDRMIAAAIAKYKQLNNKAPSAQEVEQLKSHIQGLSNPTSGLRSGMSAQPRAAFELATDPNLINPNTARDEFLTKMTTGRTTKGTSLRPVVEDITDPSVVKNIESQQLEEGVRNSITPSADYLGEVSTNIENSALQGGAFDKLKQGFFEKTGRYPDADETNALIAEFNPARHQYGSQGVGIMSQRPPSAKGMTDFRNAARNEGVEESYLTKRQGNYPQYIQDELTIQRGQLPSIKEAKKRVPKDVQPTDFYVDENGNLVKIYPTMKAGGGQITPDEMRYMMVAYGKEPQKFSNGGMPTLKDLDEWTLSQKDPYGFAPKFQAYEPGIRERATDKIAPYLEKIGMTPRRAREQAGVITGDIGSMDPQGITAKTGIGPTMFLDPLAPFEAVEQFKRGDTLSGALSASILPGQAMAIKPLKTMGANKIKKLK